MIVVTTPTGQIGSQLLDGLLPAGERVRVIVRDPARLPENISQNVEIVQGSHGDGEVVKRAFRDADAVFWLVPADPKAKSVEAAYVDFSRPACDAFRSEDVRHVVGVSSFGRGRAQAGSAGLITASLAMDDLIAASGVHYRALAMPSFMDNLLRQIAAIKSQGVFSSPTPGGLKMATCATRDIAQAAAKLLTHRTWTGVADVPVLGPEDLSFDEMARTMSLALGKPVRFEEIPDEALKSALLKYGRSEAMAQGVIDMMAAIRAGIYSNEPRATDSAALTSFREWCDEVLKPAVEK